MHLGFSLCQINTDRSILFWGCCIALYHTMEKANSQAESLEQIGQGIEQLSGVVQGNAASSEENTAISINLAEGAAKMRDRVNIFKLF